MVPLFSLLYYRVRNIRSIALKRPDESLVNYVIVEQDRSRFAVSTAAHWQTTVLPLVLLIIQLTPFSPLSIRTLNSILKETTMLHLSMQPQPTKVL